MTSPVELFRRAQSFGLHLEADGGDLVVKPRSRCPPDFADVLRQHKSELLDWLSRTSCPGWQVLPPVNLPLNPVMPRPTPDNRERVIAHLLRQGCDRPGPLTVWLVRRESAYFDGPGRHWDCALHAYAAARDAACWQLNRSEDAVWELLASFDEYSLRPRTPGRRCCADD
jgi:hypothetical protein